jgi:hypothetical protein
MRWIFYYATLMAMASAVAGCSNPAFPEHRVFNRAKVLSDESRTISLLGNPGFVGFLALSPLFLLSRWRPEA